eukprot:TRINITY_DN8687_c1_g2_i2.p1 TRINITY_DN8687_c1_g2~~TRINITY_DN8687_c1_g2_i2.p1  ORF type:complete len:356 (+),score=37.46 TRINITY_DN8687_c1_g2_i2:152-1069(+)
MVHHPSYAVPSLKQGFKIRKPPQVSKEPQNNKESETREHQNPSPILEDHEMLLPIEIMFHVFSYLGPSSLCQLRLVSRKWKSIADQPSLWHSLCQSHGLISFNHQEDLKTIDWKRIYRLSSPWRWNLQPNITEVALSSNGMTLAYSGSKMDWITCLSEGPIDGSHRYFEISIDRAECPRNSIQVVFGCTGHMLGRQSNTPFGWNTSSDRNSWCYRGDGVIMSRGLADVTKGQTFGSGDTVGFKVNLKKKSLTFYKNGVPQGRPLTGIVGNLYPAVSIISGNQISIHQVTSIPSSLKNQSIKLITK